MKIIHICDGWEKWNGAANIARLIAKEQEENSALTPSSLLPTTSTIKLLRWTSWHDLRTADEVWIHCGWKPCLWWAAIVGRKVKWMPEACYDPVRLHFHGWKKWLVGPIERFCLRRCDALVATCDAEADWIRAYLGKKCPPIEIQDIKRFFDLSSHHHPPYRHKPLRVLYLGRNHPLKGHNYLQQAIECVKHVDLKIVSNAFGDEKDQVFNWCDVLALPTLSDNFGLVVAEALEKGKRVIVTDGAPAWKGQVGVTYINKFLKADDRKRVQLLKHAILHLIRTIPVEKPQAEFAY